jgi:hypothetical protein
MALKSQGVVEKKIAYAAVPNAIHLMYVAVINMLCKGTVMNKTSTARRAVSHHR